MAKSIADKSPPQEECRAPVIIVLTETWMNQYDYADLLRLTFDMVGKRIKQGLYETPPGRTLPCYYMCGKKSTAVFSVRLANEYYQMNTQKAKDKK